MADKKLEELEVHPAKKPGDDSDQSFKAVVCDRKVLKFPTTLYQIGATGATSRNRINDVPTHLNSPSSNPAKARTPKQNPPEHRQNP